MNNPLLYTFLIFFITHSAVWFQTNGQFVWSLFKDHPFILSLFGIPIILGYILYTDFPDIFTIFGALTITLSGIYVLIIIITSITSLMHEDVLYLFFRINCC